MKSIPSFLILLTVGWSSPTCPSNEDLQFIQQMLNESEWQLTLYETARLQSRHPQCPDSIQWERQAAEAHYHLGRYRDTRELLGRQPSLDKEDFHRFLFAFLLDLPPGQAVEAVRARIPSAVLSKEENGLYRLAFDELTGGKSFLKNHLTERQKSFLEFSQSEGGYKHPAMAAGFAVFPGMGYLYNGETQNALLGLSLITVFYAVGSTYAYYHAPVRAGLFFSLGGIFHLSSLYGAIKSTRHHNHKKKLLKLRKLHQVLHP